MREGSIFIAGNDQAIILYHSFTNNPKIFWPLINGLKQAGYTILAPMFSGHEQDDLDNLLNYSASDWVTDGKEAIDFLETKGYKKIAVFGLSLGGLVAIKMVLENDNVIAAGTFASPVIPSPEGSHVAAAFLKTYQARKRLAGVSGAEIDDMIENIKPRLAETLESITNLAINLGASYHTINTPFFIAHGGKDEVVDPTIAERFKLSLTNVSNLAFHYYPEGGHYLTLGDTGNELREDLLAFLTKLDWD